MADFYFADVRDRSPNSEMKVEKNSRAVEYYVVQDDKLSQWPKTVQLFE